MVIKTILSVFCLLYSRYVIMQYDREVDINSKAFLYVRQITLWRLTVLCGLSKIEVYLSILEEYAKYATEVVKFPCVLNRVRLCMPS